MPDRPSWIERLPDILATLEDPKSPPFLDRDAIEKLFQLKRRQAIALIHKIDGYKLGKSLVVNRGSLLGYLRRRRMQKQSRQERIRKQSVFETLSQARTQLREGVGNRRSIPIPAIRLQKDVYQREIADLPPGIELAPGRLTITFQEPAELLQKLFELSQAVANDYETLVAAVTPPREERPELKDGERW